MKLRKESGCRPSICQYKIQLYFYIRDSQILYVGHVRWFRRSTAVIFVLLPETLGFLPRLRNLQLVSIVGILFRNKLLIFKRWEMIESEKQFPRNKRFTVNVFFFRFPFEHIQFEFFQRLNVNAFYYVKILIFSSLCSFKMGLQNF